MEYEQALEMVQIEIDLLEHSIKHNRTAQYHHRLLDEYYSKKFFILQQLGRN